MRWADVNLDDAVWITPADDTKAERKQLVPLSKPVLEIIQSIPRLGEYVFSSDGRSHVSGYTKGEAMLDAFVAAGGDPVTPWPLHDLRRTAATHMARLGVSEDTVGHVLNHAARDSEGLCVAQLRVREASRARCFGLLTS